MRFPGLIPVFVFLIVPDKVDHWVFHVEWQTLEVIHFNGRPQIARLARVRVENMIPIPEVSSDFVPQPFVFVPFVDTAVLESVPAIDVFPHVVLPSISTHAGHAATTTFDTAISAQPTKTTRNHSVPWSSGLLVTVAAPRATSPKTAALIRWPMLITLHNDPSGDDPRDNSDRA